MSRSIPWRRICPDKISSRMDRAARARIYLLRATGPTGFLLTAEGDERKFKVFLGDQHSCTCPTFLKEKDLCVHILWVLMKKFRVPKENPVVYQLGLVEREIGEVVRGLFTQTGDSKVTNRKVDGEPDSREKLSKKQITEDDVCPICQEDLFGQAQPTTYCKYGCGNSVHIKCMKIWAEHQKSSGETIVKCPLCRVDFGPFETIKSDYLRSIKNKQRYDVHIGAVCAHCRVSPITGRCYRCTICSNYQLCKDCFQLDPHPQHSFHFKQKPNQRWRPACMVEVIPSAVVNDLERREITEQDYNLLLQLDSSSVNQSSVPAYVLNSFPTETLADDNHRLIVNANEKCGVCLCSYRLSQVVRRLPCHHEFHRVCIDSWLSRDHNVCPIDGQTIRSDLVRTSSNQRLDRVTGNSRQRNPPRKKISLSALRKRPRTLYNKEPTIPQDFSLHGSSLRQRNHGANSEAQVEDSETTVSPIPSTQIVELSESSSKHILFNTNLPGRAVVSAERVMRYGRHSGDSHLRTVKTSTRNVENKKVGPRSVSLNDITLSGQKISTTEVDGRTLNRTGTVSINPTRFLVNHDPSLLHTTIVTSSPDPNRSHVPVDV